MNAQPEYVWYVAYGSNMNLERFMYYIKGGYYPLTGVSHAGCQDRSDPLDSYPFRIPYVRYFGLSYTNWGQGGVAFIDPMVRGSTLGRAYLITKQQYLGIKAQEGPHYQYDLDLGEFKGHPVITCTSDRHVPGIAEPSPLYRFVYEQGLEQTHELEVIKGSVNALR